MMVTTGLSASFKDLFLGCGVSRTCFVKSVKHLPVCG